MSEQVLTALQEYHRLNDELTTILELKEDAFRVFDGESIVYPEPADMMSFYSGPWKKLHQHGIHMQKNRDIFLAFSQASQAIISRAEFNELLQPSREAIEAYIASLEASVEKSRNQIFELYDEKLKNNLSIIFTAPEVKELFINFLLS